MRFRRSLCVAHCLMLLPLLLIAVCTVGPAAAQDVPKEVQQWADRLQPLLVTMEAAAAQHPDVLQLGTRIPIFYVLSAEMNCYAMTVDEPCDWSKEAHPTGRFVAPFEVAPPVAARAGRFYAFAVPHYLDGSPATDVSEARRITLGMPYLEYLKDAAPILLVAGHELGHVVLQHGQYVGVGHTQGGVVAPIDEGLVREDEFEADRFGMEVGLAAGYSYKDLCAAAARRAGTTTDLPPLHLKDHPSWRERLARMDAPNQQYWRCLVSFDAGVASMAAGNYESAFEYFGDAASTLPKEAQPLVNKGAAALLVYYDLLDTKSREALISQGGAIPSPPWFNQLRRPTRGGTTPPSEEWLAKARQAYEQALALEPKLTEAEVGIAIAGMLGTTADPAASEAKLRALLGPDSGTGAPTTASCLVSGGMVAARLAGRDLDPWARAAERLIKQGEPLPPDLVANIVRYVHEGGSLLKGLKVRELLGDTLGQVTEGAPMRAALAELWESCYPGEAVPDPPRQVWRRSDAITLTLEGEEVELRVPTTEARFKAKLSAESVEMPVAGADNLKSIYYPTLGLRAYCGKEEGVFMAVLAQPTGYVRLRAQGVANPRTERLELGMKRTDVRSLLGVRSVIPMTTGDESLLYYGEPGVAVRFRGKGDEGVVAALALIPY